MSIVDAIIILLIALGAVWGFKKGVISSAVSLVGTVAVIILAYTFKSYIANFMLTYFPFFKFGGYFEGLMSINILIYEGIAFLILFTLLSCVLSIIIQLSNIIETILKATVILAIPSKILGAILGAIEAFVLVFIGLFVMAQFNFSAGLVHDSNVGYKVLTKTPILSRLMGNAYEATKEIYELHDKYHGKNQELQYNAEALGIMIKYRVVEPEVVQKLIDDKKLPYDLQFTDRTK